MTDKPLNVENAARYLDISKDHLYHLTSSGKIPHFKPGGKRIYFFKSDLDNYIRSGRVKTEQELEEEAADYLAS